MTDRVCSWPAPPSGLLLAADQVHVWQASLEQPATRVEQLAETLTDDERERAGRFHQERDRRRFVVGRGVLRAILGSYLHIEASRIQFHYGPQGKPHLVQERGGADLRFNLAHAQDLALYAFALGREIGIDLEKVRPLPDADEIASQFFSARERATYQALLPAQRQKAFFRCWTRKEAYIKAIGEGLTRPLDQFDVSLAPGQPARLLYVEGDTAEAVRWSLETLTPAPDYMAALAVEGHNWNLVLWRHD